MFNNLPWKRKLELIEDAFKPRKGIKATARKYGMSEQIRRRKKMCIEDEPNVNSVKLTDIKDCQKIQKAENIDAYEPIYFY